MPALEDPKKERFAQHLAAGAASQTAAYKAAGFKGEGSTARAAAARLAAQDSVRQRVRELQAEQFAALQHAQAEAAAAAGIDMAWLQKQGKEILKGAIEEKDFAAASQTLERIAKICGLWVDRSAAESNQVQRIYSATPLSEEEWERMHGEAGQKSPAKPVLSS